MPTKAAPCWIGSPKELSGELLKEFSADGTNFEGSIPYHRFATESALVTAILLDRNGRSLSDDAREQCRRMLHFIDAYTKPNGLAPQVGDNDNGRILVLHDYAGQEYRDHRHILAVGSVWLGLDAPDVDLSAQSPRHPLALGTSHTASGRPGPAIVSGNFPSNGFALIKSDETYLLVGCGRINPMSGGGHNHCDQLSFEFHDAGHDLIIDPGAAIYGADPDTRNEFRSTAAHNTLQLGDLEQQEFSPLDLFAMTDRAEAQVEAWEVMGGDGDVRGKSRRPCLGRLEGRAADRSGRAERRPARERRHGAACHAGAGRGVLRPPASRPLASKRSKTDREPMCCASPGGSGGFAFPITCAPA